MKAPTCVRDAKDIVSDLYRNPSTHKLLSDICTGKPVGRFLMTHRDQLFMLIKESRVSISLRYLFFDNLPFEHSALTNPVVRTSELQLHQSQTFAEDTTEHFAGIQEDLRSVACLLLIRFIRQNPALKDLTDRDSVSMQDVLRSLGDKKLSFDVFKEFEAFFKDEDRSEDDVVLRGKITKHANAFRDYVPSLTRNIMAISNSSQLLIPSNMFGSNQWRELTQLLNLAPVEYAHIIDDLCALDLAESVGEIFWCDRSHGKPYIMSSASPIRPRELNIGCPKCGASMSASATFVLNPLLDEAIYSKDGILGIAVHWLLQYKLRVPFESGKYSGDYESDFVVSIGARKCLIECKMYKYGKDAESVHGRIEGAVVQAMKHVKQFASDGRTIDNVMIITNLDKAEIEPAFADVRKTKKKLLGKQLVSVINLCDLERSLVQFRENVVKT